LGSRANPTPSGVPVAINVPGSSVIPRLQLPWQPPEEYDFEIEFTPMEGSGDVAQVLSTKGRSFAWRLDVGLKAGRKAGLETIDGVGIMDRKDGTLMRQNLLTNGRCHRSLVEVRKTGICGYLDGEKLVDLGRYRQPPRHPGAQQDARSALPRRCGLGPRRHLPVITL